MNADAPRFARTVDELSEEERREFVMPSPARGHRGGKGERIGTLEGVRLFRCRFCSREAIRDVDDLGVCPACARRPLREDLQGLDPWKGRTGGSDPDPPPDVSAVSSSAVVKADPVRGDSE